MEVKRTHVAKEILTTERTYVDNLENVAMVCVI